MDAYDPTVIEPQLFTFNTQVVASGASIGVCSVHRDQSTKLTREATLG
jgi:hypothetical protein